jgi:hypothetical protein
MKLNKGEIKTEFDYDVSSQPLFPRNHPQDFKIIVKNTQLFGANLIYIFNFSLQFPECLVL